METNTNPEQLDSGTEVDAGARVVELMEYQYSVLCEIRDLLRELTSSKQYEPYKQKFPVEPLPKSYKNGPNDPMGPVTFGPARPRNRSVLVGSETQIGGQRGPQ